MEEDQRQPKSEKPQGAPSAHPLDQRIVQVARVVMANKQQVEQLSALAADLKMQMGEVLERGGSAGMPDGLGARIDKLAERVELASSRLDEQVYALKTRVTGFADGVEQWLKPARQEIEANREIVDQASAQIREQLKGFERSTREHTEQTTNQLQSMQGQIESAVARSEQHLAPVVGELGARLDASQAMAAETRDTCRALQNQIFGAVGQLEGRIASVQKAVDTALGAGLDQQIARLQEHVSGQFAGIQEGLDAWSRRTEEDAVHRTELSCEQKELGAALGRLEEKVEAMLHAAARQTADGGEVMSHGFRDVQKHLDTISEQLDARVARSLGEIHALNHQAHDAALAQRNEIAGGLKELGMAMLRLQGRVTDSLTDLTARQATQGDQAGSFANELGDLRDQLANLGEQLGVMTAEIDNRVTASLGNAERGTREAVAGIRTELAALGEQLAGAGPGDPRSDREMSDIRNGLAALPGQVQEKLAEAVAEIGRAPSREQEQLTCVERQLDDLREHISNIGDRLDGVTGRLETRVSEVIDGIGGGRTGAPEQIAGVEHQLTELRANMAALVTQLDVRLEPLTASLQQQERASEAVDTKLEKELANLKSWLAAVPKQVEAKVADAIVQVSRTPSREQEQLTSVERQLDDLREHIAALGDRLERVSSDLDRRPSATPAGTGDSARHDRELADLKDWLAAVPGQIEDRVAEAISGLAVGAPPSPERLAGIERQINTLAEQMIEQGLATLRDEFKAVTEHLDTRVSEVLSGLEAHNGQSREEPGTREHLSDLVGRLEQQVATAIGEVAVREADGDHAARFELQLDRLQDQLATLGDRFGALESSLSDLDTTTRASRERTPGHVEPAPPQEVVPIVERAPFLDEGPFVDEAPVVDMTPEVDETPITDEPVIDEPIIDEPIIDEPIIEEPSTIEVTPTVDDTPMAAEPVAPDTMDLTERDATAFEVASGIAQTPALAPGEMVDKLVNMINSGNPDLMFKFVSEQYALSSLAEVDVEQRVEVYMAVHEETGELRVVTIEDGDDGAIIVILQARLSLDRQRFEIVREIDPPHKIVQVNIDTI